MMSALIFGIPSRFMMLLLPFIVLQHAKTFAQMPQTAIYGTLPLLGEWSSGQLFTMRTVGGDLPVGPRNILYRQTLSRNEHVREFIVPMRDSDILARSPRERYLLTWRIEGKYLWNIAPCWPRIDEPVFGMLRMPLHQFENLRQPYLSATKHQLPKQAAMAWGTVMPEFASDVPLTRCETGSYLWVANGMMPLVEPSESVSYDFYLTSSRSFLLFINIRGSNVSREARYGGKGTFIPVEKRHDDQIVIFEYQFRCVRAPDPMAKGEDGQWRGVWKHKETLISEFVDPFRAFPGKNTYFFVTESGKLYSARPDDHDVGQRVVRPVVGARSPILAVIRDADADRAFAFTQGAWFEIKEPLETHEFNLGPLNQVKPDDPLPTLHRCVESLQAAGLLHSKPKN